MTKFVMKTKPLTAIYRSANARFSQIRYAKSQRVKQFWYKRTPNFGDTLNTFLTQAMSGAPPIWIDPDYYNAENLLAVGSILGRANKHSIIWGSGFISADSFCREAPAKILSVRGPLTRDKLIEQGIDCPAIFGDPALIMPHIYRPKREKKYRLGIIPHYVDIDSPLIRQFSNQDGVLVIDTRTSNTMDFIDSVLECEKIASSSLHGLIIADAYQIPSAWTTCSNSIKGGSFKFHDYFASIGADQAPILPLEMGMVSADFGQALTNRRVRVDIDRLVAAFPYGIDKQGESRY